MSINISKSKVIIIFNSVGNTFNYKSNGSVLYHVGSTKYLGVTLHADCKFNKHTLNNTLNAKGQLGIVQRAL